ncbi:hypothetical protein NUW54_g8698 [Trametes sanguinea]|uniref:Uncharacterized protein n=1 Tax=Trametes sanguinea TaxID=158606 RepID=A0ACC1PBI2_9APHY|nr:hypothetical protein NUW54_g8698 [Trametes sanguinea]
MVGEYFNAFDDDLGDFDPDYDWLDVPEVMPEPPVALPHSAAPISAENDPSMSFYSQYTKSIREDLSSGLRLEKRVERVLVYMNKEGLNLEVFLDAVFWGDQECVANPVIQHERTVFMSSPTLPNVLNRTADRASKGKASVQDFALEQAGRILEKEVVDIMPRFRPGPDPLSKASLTSVNFREFGAGLISSGTPHLWRLLQRLAWSLRQQRENTVKNPFHVCSCAGIYVKQLSIDVL